MQRLQICLIVLCIYYLLLVKSGRADGRKNRIPKQMETVTSTDLDFWGNQLVTIDDGVEESNIFGYTSALRGIKHSSSSRYPIASVSKLFTAVAIHQLHEQGILDIDASIADYLDSTDFAKIGYVDTDGSGKYCPKLLNSDECQVITLNDLLSMNSGIVAVHGSLCPYDFTSPFIQYCQDPCNTIWYQPYQGSIGYYMQFWMNAPLTFIPGDGVTYEYSNANYVFAGYLIEKLSGLSYREYVEENIFKPLDLEDTYYDPFEGVLMINKDVTDAHILYTDTTTMNNIGIGQCQNDFNIGFWNAAAGLVSTNLDIHRFYKHLFDKRNQPSILFQNKETIKRLLYPSVQMDVDEGLYFVHGVSVKFADEVDIDGGDYSIDNDVWPELITMSGRNICTQMRTRLVYLDNDEELIVSVFSNGRRVYVDELIYDAMKYTVGGLGSKICHLLPGMDFSTGLDEANALLEKWSNIVLSEQYTKDEEEKLDDMLVKKEDRERINRYNAQYKAKRRGSKSTKTRRHQ